MIYYSIELKQKEYLAHEKIILTGKNNWKSVKLFYSFLLVFCISLALFISNHEASTAAIRFFTVIPLAALSIIAFNVLTDGRKRASLLHFLEINKNEIRFNYYKNANKAISIKNDSISNFIVLVEGEWKRNPTFKFYLNDQKVPFAEFRYLISDQFKITNTIESFTSILNLKKNRHYQLDQSRVIFEYVRSNQKASETKIKNLHFNVVETSNQLIIELIANPKKRIEIDFKKGILRSTYHSFFTYEIELDKITGYEKSLNTEIVRKDGKRGIVKSILLIKEQGKKMAIEILSSQIKSKRPWEMLEFESYKELDQLVDRLNRWRK